MRAIADLTVVCAADANQLRAILRASLNCPGAMYIRLGRGRDPEVYREPPTVLLGKAVRLREGDDADDHRHRIAGACEPGAADALAAAGNQHPGRRHAHDQAIRRRRGIEAARETGAVLTVEEHNITGGWVRLSPRCWPKPGVGVHVPTAWSRPTSTCFSARPPLFTPLPAGRGRDRRAVARELLGR